MALRVILDLWDEWNLQGFVLLSLLLQFFFILCAPIRKKIANNLINPLWWWAYLMANWVAPFVIGLISRNQGNSSAGAAEVEGALQVFWASFLLLHFGGLDIMGAYCIVDSALWGRYLASFIFQVGATIYVFVKICPSDKSLMIPTILVLFVAFIKNVERLWALYLTNHSRLRKWVLSEDTFSNVDNKLIEELNDSGDKYSNEEEALLLDSIVVKHAYYFFQIFKIFLTDLIFTCRQRKMSYEYFHKVSALDAMRIISVELQFMYQVLHTKFLAIHSKWSYIFCFIAFVDIVVAYILFNHLKKNQLPELDVKITNALLFGGIVLDVISLLMLISSDWTIARIKGYKTRSSKLDSFLHKLVSASDNWRKPRFVIPEAESSTDVTYTVLDTPFMYRRWSETICACNLLSESLSDARKMFKCGRLWDIIVLSSLPCFCSIITLTFVSRRTFIKELWIFIFNEVKCKSEHEDSRKIFEARGDLFLKNSSWGINCRDLLKYVTEANYDTSVIIWHLATEICYNREKPEERNDEREFSKILSDYMLYLSLNKHNMIFPVVGVSQVTLAKTLHDLGCYISGAMIKDIEDLCDKLYNASSETSLKSPLGEGINLAREMERLGELKWKVISGVWVEMLSYAAMHVKGVAHVQELRKGGELLTFVWLLMAHFGCFYKPGLGMYRESWDERDSDDSDASIDNNEYST